MHPEIVRSLKNPLQKMLSTPLILLTLLPSTIISPRPDCVITCCVDCKEDYNCAVCYKLNTDKAACPCMQQIFPKYNLDRVGKKQEVQRTIISKKSDSQNSEISKSLKNIPVCQPSCCTVSSCTKITCPLCYRRLRNNPQECPCVNTGKRSMPRMVITLRMLTIP